MDNEYTLETFNKINNTTDFVDLNYLDFEELDDSFSLVEIGVDFDFDFSY